MDLLLVGIVVLAWLTLSALIVAFAAIAGRADRRETRQVAERRAVARPPLFADARSSRIRTRRTRGVPSAQRANVAR